MSIIVEQLPVDGAPQVGITVDGLSTNAVISVGRSWDGGQSFHEVRGAMQVARSGSAFFRDFVPPLNVEALYRVIVHSGAMDGDSAALFPGMPGLFPSPETIPTPASLTVPGDEATILVPSSTGWIQDPLDPRGAVPVLCMRDNGAVSIQAASFTSFTRGQVADRVTVEGSRLPVASVGIRQAVSNIPLHLRAYAAAQGELVRSMRALFDRSGVLVLRGLPADLPLDPVAHVIAGDVAEVPVVGGVLGMYNDWRLVVDQVRPSSLKVAVPFFTYDQVAALWAGFTYDGVLAVRPGDTYLDWMKSPEVP